MEILSLMIAVLCAALLPGFVFMALFITVLNLRTPVSGTRLGSVRGKGWHDD